MQANLLRYLRVPVLAPIHGRQGLVCTSLFSTEAKGSFLNKGEVTDRVLKVLKQFQKVDPSKVSVSMHAGWCWQSVSLRKDFHCSARVFSPADRAALSKGAKELGSVGTHINLVSETSGLVGPTTLPAGLTSTEGNSSSKRFVVLVESPAKAKTIEKYLGADFMVLPTHGHVRDLAARAGSVRPDDDYAMVWEVPEDAQSHVTKIKNALKGAKCLVLASDPDREGEAIAWHVSELMKAEGVLKNKKVKVVRVAFNEITKNAILQAMQAPRDICMTLVTAYLARRALDYLIGYALSPVLWRKLPGSRSAGRVQSAALRMVCERESEIEQFQPQEYWTVEAFGSPQHQSNESNKFVMRPTHFNGKKLEKFSLISNEAAKELVNKMWSSKIEVVSVKKSSIRKNPPQPYITSTLQQDALDKLGFGVMKTMALAQKLYEGVKLGNDELTGLITYMRTDGLQLSNDAVEKIRSLAAARYGHEYVPAEPRKFVSKVKNAQEAHEAIRPTDPNRLPSELRGMLDEDALQLYCLIWRRTMACQMEQAVLEEVSVDLATGDGAVCLRATSSNVSFPGFFSALQDKDATLLNDNDDDGQSGRGELVEEDNKGSVFMSFQKGDPVRLVAAEPRQHFTQPPPRFTEGSLVKAMEEFGIGRPSTYAATLKTLQSRKYVRMQKHRIFPEIRGRMVVSFLSNYFPDFVNYNFTARLEEQLDEVSSGRSEWKDVLIGFWPDFHGTISSVMKIPIQEVVDMLQKTCASQVFKGLGENGYSCPSCNVGKLTLKLSRYGLGYFFGCDSYPECRFKAQALGDEEAESSLENENMYFTDFGNMNNYVGVDPSTNREVYVKSGPFGPYVQLGQDNIERRCVRIPGEINPADVNLDQALQLLKYPMMLGKHGEDGDPVWLGIGRYSYYVKHRNAIAQVPKNENPEKIDLQKALQLLQSSKQIIRVGRKKDAVVSKDQATDTMGKAKSPKQNMPVKLRRKASAEKTQAKKETVTPKKASEVKRRRTKSAGKTESSKVSSLDRTMVVQQGTESAERSTKVKVGRQKSVVPENRIQVKQCSKKSVEAVDNSEEDIKDDEGPSTEKKKKKASESKREKSLVPETRIHVKQRSKKSVEAVDNGQEVIKSDEGPSTQKRKKKASESKREKKASESKREKSVLPETKIQVKRRSKKSVEAVENGQGAFKNDEGPSTEKRTKKASQSKQGSMQKDEVVTSENTKLKSPSTRRKSLAPNKTSQDESLADLVAC